MENLMRPMRSAIAATVLATAFGLAGCGSIGTPGAGGTMTAEAQIGAIRSSHGMTPLSRDAKLEAAALEQAGYMARAGKMEHTTGWGKDFATRIRSNGIEGNAAENLAHGRMDVGKVFQMWMDSPPHRHNMLNPRYRHYGLAYVKAGKNSDKRYWALVLGD